MSHITRVDLIYESHTLVDDREALGLTDFRVSLNGNGSRPARNGENLGAARFELRHLGMKRHDVTRFSGRGANVPARYIETWSFTPPEPLPQPPGLKTVVRYNRRRRCYEVAGQDGQGLDYAAKKVDAEWAQLLIEDPHVHDLIQRFTTRYPDPAIVARAIRAGRLIIAGHVDQVADDSYFIVSQMAEDRGYNVFIPHGQPERWRCTIGRHPDPDVIGDDCPDQRAPVLKTGSRCQHIIAAYLYKRLQTKKNEDPAATGSSPIHAAAVSQASTTPPEDTTPPPPRQAERSPATHPAERRPAERRSPRVVVARYADGRPARYSDGTIIRYTAGGKAVELPA